MMKLGLIFAAVLLLAVNYCDAAQNVLKCWRCSSDSPSSAFCADPFDAEIIPVQERYWAYVNCTAASAGPSSLTARPVCKKMIQEIYGQRVVSRSCHWADYNDPEDKCMSDSTPAYTKIVYCRTCTTDGCNGASGFIPIGTLVLIVPVALLKLFTY